MVRYALYFILLLIVSHLGAQNTDIPLNLWAYTIMDEWDVKSERGAFTAIKPLSRDYFAQLSLSNQWMKSAADKYDSTFISLETRRYQDDVKKSTKPLFGKLFEYPSDLFSVSEKDFELHINPVVVWNVGKDLHGNNDELLYENYRGLELRGMIDNKIGFYTLLTENQARFPEYVQAMTDTTLAVPYEGFWKQYGNTGVDFLRTQAYADFNATKHLSVQFGFGKHFIGDGRRSLILSDVGNSYPYLKLQSRIWKIQYTNIYAQLIAETDGGNYGLLGIGSFPKKAFANHHLSIQVKPNLTIGLFESVIQGDSLGGTGLGIFVPTVFYKAMEQQDGSGGNTILGLDFKWNLWQTLSLYGQLVIDELIVGEAFSNSGWWGNKQGFQLGAKYFDVFGVNDLNVQLEFNRVRPYVYAHESNFTSYSHYNMALAHPLGANFREVLISLNYRPMPKIRVQFDLLSARYGNDKGALSYGRNILTSYIPANRPGDYNNNMFQGESTDLLMIQGTASYMLMHNLTLELSTTIRNESSAIKKVSAQVFGVAMRWNFPNRNYLF